MSQDLIKNYTSHYTEVLENSKSDSMKTKRLRNIVIKIFKTLNQNPNFMKR